MPGHAAASRVLAERDPALAALVARHGPMRLPPPPPVAGRFAALARNIVYQQLAGRAAAAIWGRTQLLVGDHPFTPEALRDLAAKVADGTVRLSRLGRLTDDEVVAELTQVRGIGPWTAHMFLMFQMHRLNVWPTGDYGVRNGYQRTWGLPAMPTPRELEALGEPFRPYRSVAAWYCWRAVDGLVTPAD